MCRENGRQNERLRPIDTAPMPPDPTEPFMLTAMFTAMTMARRTIEQVYDCQPLPDKA
jgi:hypothetical protein